MTNRLTNSMFRSSLAVIAAACLVGGCTLTPGQIAHHQRHSGGTVASGRRSPDPSDATAPAETQSGSEDSTLTAVEDFLKRTEDYSWPPDVTHAESAPMTGPKRPAVTPRVSIRRVASAANADARGKDGSMPSHMVVRSASPGGAPATGEMAQRREVLPAAVANTHVALGDSESTTATQALPVVLSLSIRSAVEPAAESKEPTLSSTSNQPLDAQPGETPMSADGFLERLETRVEEAGDFDSLWTLLLTQVAMNRITEPPEPTPGVSAEAQRILGGLIRLIVSTRSAARNPLVIGEEALGRAVEFRQLLADRADPEIPVVSMCRKVVTFGVYEEMGEEEFVAGRSTQTIVYSEIRNLRSEQTPDGKFRTLLATRLEVLTEGGESVWQHEEPEIEDLCRRRRTDFFIAQRIVLPTTMGEGNYILKVFAEDKLSGKANEASHPFTVYSALSLVANH